MSYNCDKYGEDHVNWWDAVDCIASSGYYPLKDWENQLDRIEAVSQKYKKPVLFSEAGCMNITGSSAVPNNWELKGTRNDLEQADWYEAMFSACAKRPWAMGLWRVGLACRHQSSQCLRRVRPSGGKNYP